MPRQKELSEDLRAEIIDLHKARKGYEVIHQSVDEMETLWDQGVGSQLKRAQQSLICEVKKQPRDKSQRFEGVVGTSVFMSLLVRLRTACLKEHADTPHSKMFSGLMKLRPSYLERTHSTTAGVERALHIILGTSSQP